MDRGRSGVGPTYPECYQRMRSRPDRPPQTARAVLEHRGILHFRNY